MIKIRENANNIKNKKGDHCRSKQVYTQTYAIEFDKQNRQLSRKVKVTKMYKRKNRKPECTNKYKQFDH